MSSPNFVSQVAALGEKNARVSVRYQEPRLASEAATRRITGQSWSYRSITMSAPFSAAPSGSRPARTQIITSQVRAPRQPGPAASLTAPSTASPPVSASSMLVSRTHGRPLAVSVAASRAASAAGCSPHPSTSTDTAPAGISPARPHSISSHRRLALAGADGDGTGVSGDGMRP